MKTLNKEQKDIIKQILDEVMSLYNEGYDVWFEFSPHVNWVQIHYWNKKSRLLSREYRFDKLDYALKYVKRINKNDVGKRF